MVAGTGAPFVGRVGELAQLEGALLAAREGHGATATVAGDAGIGKTRLVSEIATRASAQDFEVLIGRSIDLVGTDLPYQPFVEALRPVGDLAQVAAKASGSQLQVFEQTLAMLSDRADAAPLLLVLEDLHWADASTLDLALFLAHNVVGQRVLLLATFRADDRSSTRRMRRFTDGVRRSGSVLALELGPLGRDELTALIAAQADAPTSAALTEAIVTRSEGNPFFAEELLAAAAAENGDLPRGVREVLLQRVDRLDEPTLELLRLAAAAGREVSYPLLCAAAARPPSEVRESLRQAVEHGVLVAEPAGSSFRFRHALLAEAIYATILPGEREELHERLAEELARTGAAAPAELAPHWAAAGRSGDALLASVQAARQARAVFGLAEALAHLERALALWDAVPDAATRVELDLAGLCAWTAELAGQVGQALRAVELVRRAIDLVGDSDPRRAALLHVDLGEYLNHTGRGDASLAALRRAVEIVPAEPPSRERAYALGSLAGGLMVAERHAESLPICEQALVLARALGAREAEVRALTVLASDLTYTSGEKGIAYFRQAIELAEDIGDLIGLERAYGNCADALTMLGRPRESAQFGKRGIEVLRGYGIESPHVVSNCIEAQFAIGDWDEAEALSAPAVRAMTSSFGHWLLIIRAGVEVGRGEFDAARSHLAAASAALPEDRVATLYDVYLADLALWERRWTDADAAIEDGLPRARHQIRVELCAKGLRAQAELAALGRARRDSDALRLVLGRARKLIAAARRAAADVSAVTPNAAAWLALAEAEYLRVQAKARPDAWAHTAATWDRLERPPLAAYCRWREAEALLDAGASRAEASEPLRTAHAVAARIGARPLRQEVELLAERARLDLAAPEPESPGEEPYLEAELGLTRREAEVLRLIARGYTNREIAEALVISVKTAGVHVSHILAKLGAPNRREAAAVAHRLALPPVRR
jgi:DNA-binding NarL/FixJ family response regulator/tetratricopeptide (TPR) repeat protein